jgi:hypothetical protein
MKRLRLVALFAVATISLPLRSTGCRVSNTHTGAMPSSSTANRISLSARR